MRRALAAATVLLAAAALADSTLYGTDNVSMRLYRLDPQTGGATAVGSFDRENVRAIAADPRSGAVYAVDTVTDTLLGVNTDTAGLTEIAPLRARHDPFIGALAFDPTDGRLLGVDYATSRVFRIDRASGEMHLEAELDPASGARAVLAIDASGAWFVIDTDTDLLRRRGAGEDRWAVIGTPAPLAHVTGLAFDHHTGALFALDANARLLAELDPADASATLRAPHGVSFITGLAVAGSGSR